MKKCYIIAAGDCTEIKINLKEGDLVICADAGLAHAQRNNIKPDVIIGDFDSFGEIPKGEGVIVHPCEKDETDTHLAIKYALEKGYRDFVFFGMLGGRLDHTFANISLLSYLCENGANGMIVSDEFNVTAVKNSVYSFEKRENGYVSIFSFSEESVGVDIKGLKYETDNFTLKSSYPMGVSNEFVGQNAYVSVKDGTLVIIIENEK